MAVDCVHFNLDDCMYYKFLLFQIKNQNSKSNTGYIFKDWNKFVEGVNTDHESAQVKCGWKVPPGELDSKSVH